MPPSERDAPRDADRTIRHEHSASFDHGRALIPIPMWDSSDPERAPPPLPLNPQSPSLTSRAGTSSAIQSAHAALTEKARESALVPVLAKRMGEPSPERPFARGSSHRRMQSLQPGTVRDLSLMIESGRDSASSTPRSPEKFDRPSTPHRSRDPFVDSKADEKDDKALISSPRPGSTITPVIRPTVRRPHQSILGENTPPQSATMLALQNMSTPSHKEPEAPLANITNGSTALVRTPQSVDCLSNQILSLTNIATSLQKDMSQLSRRSRDNATDLMSLKEATNSRDEDIRKSLRELLHTLAEAKSKSSTRDPYGGPLLPDGKAHSSSPLSMSKIGKISLPRIPSPNSFAASIDRDSMTTPSLYGPDTPATVALLEKILREMGTREGQELLLSRLSELADNLAGMASAEKVDELRRFVESTQDHSIVAAGGGGRGGNGSGRPRNFSFDEDDEPRRRELDYNQHPSGSMTARVERLLQDKDSRRASAPPAHAADVVSEDVLKIIRTVKDSVAQGGGLTAEVKALVRELRGEVLGMGREIGRRLDEVNTKSAGKSESTSKEEMTRVVAEGLAEMKQHINQLLKEHRRQSAASATSRSSTVDYQEIYNAMRAALKDSQTNKSQTPELSREDVIQAVKEAWENYKPEIEIQQLGLERDEILACLEEGLQAHSPGHDQPVGATRDEVFKAVVEGLRHFVPPQVETPASLSRDEILDAVRECLEEFEFPVAPSAIGAEISKEDMVDAVKQGLHGLEIPPTRSGHDGELARGDIVDAVQQGLHSFDFPTCRASRGPDLSRDDVVQAVREGLHGSDFAPNSSALVPSSRNDDEIVSRLHDIMDYLRAEFKAISDEAKQNVAANGRDTEQVLDATKDGFDKLRTDMESYVDRASGATDQKELLAALAAGLETFRADVSELVSRDSDSSREILRGEVESLRNAVNSSLVPLAPQHADHKEVLDALQDGLSSLRTEIGSRPMAGINEILDALHEGLGDLRISIDKLHNKPTDLTANDEILDALKSGLESVRSDIDVLREESKNDKALTTVGTNAVVPAEMLKHDDIKNLEVLISQLRIKVEEMEASPPAPSPAPESALSKEDLAQIEDILRNVQESVAGMSARDAPSSTDPASREDVEAIETILRNTKARLDDLIDGEQAVRKEHVDVLESLIFETRESLSGLSSHFESLSHKEDITAVESLVTQVVAAFDEMKERHEKALEDPEKVTKTDIDAVEAACLDTKTLVEQMLKADLAALPSKDDVAGLERLVNEFRDKFDSHTETNAKAFEERQAETVGVGERVSEVKTFLEDLQGTIKGKLEEGAKGIDAINNLLETMGGTIGKNATISDDLKEMFVAMKDEFEESKAGVVGVKLEADEKFQQTTDLLVAKFDERFEELVNKYDDFQLAMEDRATKGEARDVEVETAVVGTKAVADELKSLIDALGSAVTDSLEKMEEASKTVFVRVEDLVNKSDENHSDEKAEHQLTRDQVGQAIGVVEGLQGHVVEYQPKILETIKEVLLVVGQHYEHSKTSVVGIQEKIEEAKPAEQPLLPPVEKYDDSEVQVKLDKLVGHTEVAGKAFTQLETLDKVHQQVLHTAAEVSAFMATQTQRIENEHEDREKALQETTISLERRLEEKQHLESTITNLKEEAERLRHRNQEEAERIKRENQAELERAKLEHQKEEERFRQSLREEEERLKQGLRDEEERFKGSLRDEEERFKLSLREEEERLKLSIIKLRGEQEGLNRQKIRLTADVSSLETALRLRREELHDMETRAEGLERRILEGVMDHSRVLLMANSNRAKGRDAMSRKRVPSQKPGAASKVAADSAGSKPKAAFNIAMSGNRNLAASTPPGQARRILSLNQITNNMSAGGMKRSQSVRTPGGTGVRKASWGGGGRTPAGKGYGDLGKENIEIKESDEEYEAEHGQIVILGADSDLTLADSDHGLDPSERGDESGTETPRRSSRGTTVITGAEDDYSDEDDMSSEWTASAVGTESNFGPESVVGGDGHGGNEVVLFQG